MSTYPLGSGSSGTTAAVFGAASFGLGARGTSGSAVPLMVLDSGGAAAGGASCGTGTCATVPKVSVSLDRVRGRTPPPFSIGTELLVATGLLT